MEPLKSVINEYQENPGKIIKSMNNAMSYFTTLLGQTIENLALNQIVQTQLALKIQKHILKEMLINCWSTIGCKTTDRRNFETHIRNQYSSKIENLKTEHQEQIVSIET